MAAMLAFAFTSCNKEKPADKVDATYNGYTLAECNYFKDNFTDGESLSLAKVSENTVDVNFASQTWGTFTIAAADVAGNEAPFTVTGNGTVKMPSMQGGMNEYDVTLTATVYGSDSDKNVFTFSIPDVMGGTTVVFYTNTPAPAFVVSGTYTGTLVYSVGTNEYDPVNDVVVKLVKADDAKVNVVLPEMGSGMMAIPSVELNDIDVTTSDNVTYTLAETEFSVTANSITYEGTISGTYTSDVLTLDYSMKPGAMPMNINFRFEGNK